MTMSSIRVSILFLAMIIATASSFQIPTLAKSPVAISSSPSSAVAGRRTFSTTTTLWDDKTEDGVVELADDDEEQEVKTEAAASKKSVVAPFLSQGEVSEEPVDLSDPKQARVVFYIILSLLPVLFLIPLMLGSREMIPAEMLPPVELN